MTAHKYPKTYMGIMVPTQATLMKYGGSFPRWTALLKAQGGRCGACKTIPPSHKLNIDHQHVRGFKNLLPISKWKYVRGLVCYMCNHYRVARGATPENLRGAADYLERYLWRRDGWRKPKP